MEEEVTLTNSMEDYLEAISVLGEKKKYVRVRDIAKYMKVKMPSVTGALKLLAKKNLVDHEKYEYVGLTEQGTVIAREIRRRHDAILRFLTEVLNMDPETSERDACGIEHAISATTLDRLLKMIECIQECPRGVPECMRRFEYYVEYGEKPPIACCEEMSKGRLRK
jgi:DtxR family Mn-dependent transcriptional regulator